MPLGEHKGAVHNTTNASHTTVDTSVQPYVSQQVQTRQTITQQGTVILSSDWAECGWFLLSTSNDVWLVRPQGNKTIVESACIVAV